MTQLGVAVSQEDAGGCSCPLPLRQAAQVNGGQDQSVPILTFLRHVPGTRLQGQGQATAILWPQGHHGHCHCPRDSLLELSSLKPGSAGRAAGGNGNSGQCGRVRAVARRPPSPAGFPVQPCRWPGRLFPQPTPTGEESQGHLLILPPAPY